MNYLDVMTGEVVVGVAGDVLRSSAIGSCVVVCAYSLRKKVGGQAHVMLPGYAQREECPQKNRYCGNAIESLLEQMGAMGVEADSIEACIAGAANVLKRPDDTTAINNLDFVVEFLKEKKIKIQAQSVGGTTRRSVLFDIGKGSVFSALGDEAERLLWLFI